MDKEVKLVHHYYDSIKKESSQGIEIGKLINGQKNGLWKTFTNENNIFEERRYINGLMVGEIIVFYPNTNIINFQGEYSVNGNQTGEWKWFYENGNLNQIVNYKEGVFNGIWKHVSENGERIEERLYI